MRARLRLNLLTLTTALFLIGPMAEALVRIPKNLSREDQRDAVRILGFGTSSKFLSNPYPLGGYSGLEVGLIIENIPISDLGALGDEVESQSSLIYPKLSIGKGLYSDFDIYIHFIPYTQKSSLSEFGGLGRWVFLQAAYIPTSLSLIAHGNITNINNQLITQSWGADLQIGLTVNQLSVFLGTGYVESTGKFIGGAQGITASQKNETAFASGPHSTLGMAYRLEPVFLSVSMDRYDQVTWSFKVGLSL